ncbi:MAG: hypothetical protein WCO00_04715 [Rhodospirillaceae bacterium]
MSDITLMTGSRNALISLQASAYLMTRTENRLTTGLKVSSAVDNAVNYYKSKALSDRAADFSLRKADIEQGISSMKAGISGGTLADSILRQMKGIVNSVRTAESSTRTALSSQFSDLARQINTAVNDANYQGLNLIDNSSATITVYFNQGTSASLTARATNLRASKLLTTMAIAASSGGIQLLGNMLNNAGAGAAGGFSVLTSQAALSPATILDKLSSVIDRGVSRIRSQATLLGGNVSLLQSRVSFTDDYTNTLTDGAGKMTLADLNEEGATLVSLQARQQIGIQALNIAGQQQSAMLSLLH